MDVTVVGGGPGGLYASLLLKKQHPSWEITVFERNPPDVTYGWGIVFPKRMPPVLRDADRPSYEDIADAFVQWDPFDIYHRGTRVRCGGQTFSSLQRTAFLGILQDHCREQGVTIEFETEADPTALRDSADLLIGADGLPSDTRSAFADAFDPTLVNGRDPFAWFGTEKPFDAITHIYVENEDGFWRAHAYPGTTSTFAVDTDPATFEAAGIADASEADYLAYLEDVFEPYLDGHAILSKEDKWRRFVTVRNERLSHGNVVLLGDAAHTAHYTVGSGTSIAMEDAIALAEAFEAHPKDRQAALDVYERTRRSAVRTIQTAAERSRIHFENVKRYAHMDPLQFAFLYFTRTGLVTRDALRGRDRAFVDAVDRWFADEAGGPAERSPAFQPMTLQGTTYANRIAVSVSPAGPDVEALIDQAVTPGTPEAGLLLVDPLPVAGRGTGTQSSHHLGTDAAVDAWAEAIDRVHEGSETLVGGTLSHPIEPKAGGDGPRPETVDEAGRDRLRRDFVDAASRAAQAGFDHLTVDVTGRSALSTDLGGTNGGPEDSGSAVGDGFAFPRSVLDATRAAWPDDRPLSVAIEVADGGRGGLDVEASFVAARQFAEAGCDLLTVVPAGPVTMGAVEVDETAGYYSHWLRNETGTPTLSAAGYPSTDAVDTAVAAGRADLCTLDMDEADPDDGIFD